MLWAHSIISSNNGFGLWPICCSIKTLFLVIVVAPCIQSLLLAVCVCVDAVNLASSLALTEGMLAAHLLPFTLFMALQIKTTFTHTLSPALPTALLTLPLTLPHLLTAELRQVHLNIPPPLTILLFQQP